MKIFTRQQFGDILSATTSSRTIKSDFMIGTIWEEDEVTEDWIVSYIEVDSGVLVIECCHPAYYLPWMA